MSAPDGFTWIEKPLLGAMAQPQSLAEYQWLREHGVQLVISFSEDPPPRHWINEAGLFSLHIPVVDMHPPSQKQIELCLTAIRKAHKQDLGVALHCSAGLGRTGTMVACYFVEQGLGARDAITRVRRLRPGSVETDEQADAIAEFARRHKLQQEFEGP
jgi:atypical dual specificity phosphatase